MDNPIEVLKNLILFIVSWFRKCDPEIELLPDIEAKREPLKPMWRLVHESNHPYKYAFREIRETWIAAVSQVEGVTDATVHFLEDIALGSGFLLVASFFIPEKIITRVEEPIWDWEAPPSVKILKERGPAHRYGIKLEFRVDDLPLDRMVKAISRHIEREFKSLTAQ